MKVKANSFAFCGGAFGDEGKGRIVDEYVNHLTKQGKIVVYRDNGGANAGHTVTLPTGERVALHQLPSAMFSPKATVVLGKGMVIHPSDLLTEIEEVRIIAKNQKVATIMIDEMAVLSLDTHRAFEAALKMWQNGSKGSTGRGISPAYADVLLRHPLRMRDLLDFDEKKIQEHYELYAALCKGLGEELADMKVPTLAETGVQQVGSLTEFTTRLQAQATQLRSYIHDVSTMVAETWHDPDCSYVFEKAQAIGLDARWGVYPDVTASNTALDGIYSATEGIIDHHAIAVRAAVIKATYMSSVGTRVLPTMMDEALAIRIREDAHEYGATTKRPRDIAYLDLVALRYYAQVGDINYHVLTHMDISYLDTPIKVCVGYTLNGKKVDYRPDQEYLLKVKPVYKEFAPWSMKDIQAARTYDEIPEPAKIFLAFVAKQLKTKILMITTGPKRDQSIWVRD